MGCDEYVGKQAGAKKRRFVPCIIFGRLITSKFNQPIDLKFIM